MTVAFNNMPAVIRAPLFYAEFNPGVSPYSGTSRTILVGRMLTGGTAKTGKLIDIGGSDPNGLFGAGSMLADMALFARTFNATGAVLALPLPDPTGGAPGAGSFTITGPATSPGTLTRYVAGERYDCPVATGDTAAVIATNMVGIINAGYVKYNRRMLPPVVASAVSGVLTLTARHTGTECTMIKVEAGLDGDETDPAGVSVAIAAMSGGTGIIDIAAGLAFMAAQPGDWFASPYSSVTQLNASSTFFSDSGSGRWSPTIGLEGHYITAFDGNLAAQTALGSTRNDRHATILGTYSYSHPLWSWVAALTGIIGMSKDLGRSLSEAVEIARPLQTITLQGLRGPADPSLQWALPDRESLYRNGISAVTFAPDGAPSIDRVLTTYQFNSYGVADVTFLGIETMAISAYVKRYIKQVVTQTYPRAVLRDDNPSGLQGVVTPTQAKATMIHAYTQLCNIGGVVENATLFSQYLIVERDTDSNRLNAYLPIDVANQLVVFAANLTIFPQFDASTIALQ
ncbi:phage tail sheath C-terminal domain-containing protein [Beijerinckia sp. L45]|uniref:phage tail sheath C-terminal domain-containing protein n=1 Tax=Beijerinckia sp. L45 TaxID=1641855 RepID=UPI00131D4D90|nr:phage tail sheath C-terminal domain-containing protein [Beijerinckia sp. L45]